MKIAVIGTGYVGSVTGACFAEMGNEVVCVDKDQKKVDQFASGKAPLHEKGLDELVERNLKNKMSSVYHLVLDAVDKRKKDVGCNGNINPGKGNICF